MDLRYSTDMTLLAYVFRTVASVSYKLTVRCRMKPGQRNESHCNHISLHLIKVSCTTFDINTVTGRQKRYIL